MDRLKELDNELKKLVYRLTDKKIPFNPPIKPHAERLANTAFEDLSPDLQDLYRYLELLKEENELLEERERKDAGNEI